MIDVATEEVIHEGAANLQVNVETVGGKLLLLKEKLVFNPHSFNIQKHSISIKLASISAISLGWTKLFGFIPLTPNALIISEDGKIYRFTVFDRKAWLEKITGQKR